MEKMEGVLYSQQIRIHLPAQKLQPIAQLTIIHIIQFSHYSSISVLKV